MKRKKITTMTDEQRAKMRPWAEDWIARGLSTAPLDMDRLRGALHRCYAHANLAPPRVIVRCGSPLVLALAGPIAAHMLGGGAVRDAVRDAVDGAVDNAVRGAVRGAVDNAVRDAVGDAVRGAVDNAVGGAVGDAVRGAVDNAVGGAVGGAVRDAVGGAVRGAVRAIWWRYLGGQFWVSWPAYTQFMRAELGADLGATMNAREADYRELLESSCWIWPHTHFAIACDRPVRIDRDNRGRLHADDHMAIEWPDGWGLWMIHGVRVTEQVVVRPDTLTVDQIKSEANADVRAVMIERYGYGRWIAETGATLVEFAMDSFGRPMALMDCGPDEHRVLVCTDGSTPRVFHCPVPNTVKTTADAETWLSGGVPYHRCIAAS